jgi:iron complex outermembrane recepter protein
MAPGALAQSVEAPPPPPEIQTQTLSGQPRAPRTRSSGPARLGDVIVTGSRDSLTTARNIKRNADEVVDVIVAEDIGKLPDSNASESLARVTGVQVERGGGEAARVLVRGLPDISTTYNGRDIFTAEGRGVAMQDFPASAVAALEVFKSSSAWRLESGIAGLVNVRSRRPFDFDGLEIAGGIRGTYATQSEEYDPNGDILISNRWNTPVGEVGALVNLSYTRLRYLDSVRWGSGVVGTLTEAQAGADLAGVRYPDAAGMYYGSGDRWRPSANLALQWRPNDQLELYVDGLYQGYRREGRDRQFIVPLYDADTRFENVVLRPGGDVQSLTAVGGRRPELYQNATYDETDTYQYAMGGTYRAGPAEWSFDLARTESTYTNSTYNLDTAFASTPTVDVNFDVPREDGGVELSFRDFDTTDPANFIYRGLFDRRFQGKGDDVQARIDLKLDNGASLFPETRFGIRYVDRNASYENGERYLNQEDLRIPLADMPIDLELAQTGFNGSDVQALRTWVTPTYDSIRDNIEQLRAIAEFAPGDPPIIPEQTFLANEKAWTGYGQTDFAFNLFGLPVEGDLGVRIVATEVTVNGTTRNTVGGVETFTPVQRTSRYTDLLPSLNVKFPVTDAVQFRLAANQTRTRPSFGQLNPGLFVSPNPDSSGLRTASGGNIDLTPIESTNYDATLEYYFSDSGWATLGLFRREIDGFIVNETVDVVDPVYGDLRVTRPQNLNASVLQGVEAAFTTFLDYGFVPEWARHFGVQVNGTMVDGDLQYVSKYSYNLVGMYENGPFNARLAYNVRTKYGNGVIGEYVDDVKRLDFSASYSPTEQITVAFDASNLLGEPFRSFFDYGEGVYPRDVRREETIYSLALRFRY